MVTDFDVTSATPGSPAQVTRTTQIQAAVAMLEILGVVAPESHTVGSGNLVHRVDARNAGPLAVNPFRIDASHDGSLGNPLVTCSSGGTATSSVSGAAVARCQWGNTTTAEDNQRWMQLSWPVPGTATPHAFDVGYTATSTQATVVPDSLSVTTSLDAGP